MLTKMQVNDIEKAKALRIDLKLKLSATRLAKHDGFSGALAAGLASPFIGKMLGLGLRLPGSGGGLVLPGTTGRGKT